MSDDPIIENVAVYRCPRCDRVFRTSEQYYRHTDLCNELSAAEAASMVGKWVRSTDGDISMVGLAVSSDGPILIVTGFETSIGREHVFAESRLTDWRLISTAFEVLDGEESARSLALGDLTRAFGSQWARWRRQSSGGEGSE